MILHSMDGARSERTAISVFLETILMEHNCYNGFRYLEEKDMEESIHGTSVGIRRNHDGSFDAADKWKNTDRTRVSYSS